MVKNRRNVDDIIEHLIRVIARYLKVESKNIECGSYFLILTDLEWRM